MGCILVSPSSGTATNFTLTFENANADEPLSAGVEYGSLSDGRWELASPVLGFSSHDSTSGQAIRRLFGDWDGDGSNGTVDGNDYAAFGAAWGSTGGFGVFDWDQNGIIDASDLPQFGARFGLTV